MAVLKMLIGAVFAVALLAIVYSSLGNIGCPYSSFDEMKDIISQAARVDGKCFKKDLVCFDKNAVIDASALQKNLPGLAVNSVTARGSDITCTSDRCVVDSKMSLPASAICGLSSGVVSCNLYINSATCS